MSHGILPPLTVDARTTGSRSVEVTWDPGLVTAGITGYQVHWSSEQGMAGVGADSGKRRGIWRNTGKRMVA